MTSRQARVQLSLGGGSPSIVESERPKRPSQHPSNKTVSSSEVYCCHGQLIASALLSQKQKHRRYIITILRAVRLAVSRPPFPPDRPACSNRKSSRSIVRAALLARCPEIAAAIACSGAARYPCSQHPSTSPQPCPPPKGHPARRRPLRARPSNSPSGETPPPARRRRHNKTGKTGLPHSSEHHTILPIHHPRHRPRPCPATQDRDHGFPPAALLTLEPARPPASSRRTAGCSTRTPTSRCRWRPSSR